ncbi:MAG: hypothetical protein HIU83_10130 [Proteobacteria bacterium]|nr:hypothetical protein [Pseudomonadota bacterium]
MDTDIRVLVVDDDEFNIDLIEVMLTGLSGLEDLTILIPGCEHNPFEEVLKSRHIA